jgi:RNA polymerase sigma factor
VDTEETIQGVVRRNDQPEEIVLLERLTLARTDKKALSSLLEAYLPFIKKAVQRAFFNRQDRDDYLTEAMLAFTRAVETYRPENGTFVAYASTVMRNRLIDIARRELRLRNGLLSFSLQAEGSGIELESEASRRLYERVEEEKALGSEVGDANAEFAAWGFSVEELPEVSPKQKSTRAECSRIVKAILENDDLLSEMLLTHQLPIKKLCERVGVLARFRRKTIDRYRKYIIALVILSRGEYPYIYSFLPDGEAADGGRGGEEL